MKEKYFRTVNEKVFKLVVCGTIASFSFLGVQAQNTFTKLYGGSGTDSGRSLAMTSDGGYIAAGHSTTNSSGFDDMYVVRVNGSGELIWDKKFGGTGLEQAFGIEATNDGNYVVVGFSTSSGGAGSQDGYLIKIDDSGNKLWEKFYGGTLIDGIESVQETADGGLILGGYTNSPGTNGGYDVLLIKTDADGNITWSKKIGSPAYEYGNIVRQTNDGGYIIIGLLKPDQNSGLGDYYMVKTDSDGNVSWTKTFGWPAIMDEGKNIRQTSDGGYIITGDSDQQGPGKSDIYIIKTDASGDTLWTKIYGGTEKDVAKMIEPTPDGGYVIAGITRSFGLPNPDIWVIKIDATGGVIWEKKFGGAEHEHCYVAKPTQDGGYIVLGHSDSYDVGMYEQVYLLKLNGQGTLISTGINEMSANNIFNISPNPNEGIFEINLQNQEFKKGILKIYNFSGSILYQEDIGNNEIKKIDISHFAKGAYFIGIFTQNEIHKGKVLIQ